MIVLRSTLHVLRTLLAVLLTAGLLFAPAGRSASHDVLALVAAQAERHAALAVELEERGHVHDDGDLDEQAPGHSHGHNSGDHLHDKAGIPPVFALDVLATYDVTLPTCVEFGREGHAPSFKRPPRSTFAA